MAIGTEDQANFETILKAAQRGDLALLECKDTVSGATLRVVCAISRRGEDFEFVPLAKLFAGDPYSEVKPPM